MPANNGRDRQCNVYAARQYRNRTKEQFLAEAANPSVRKKD